MKKGLFIVYLFLFASCSSQNAQTNLGKQNAKEGFHIIVNAGSSGSRVYLYQVEPAPNKTSMPVINEIEYAKSKKTSIPMTRDPAHPEHSFLVPLTAALSYLKTNQQDIQNISIQVLSTAGMRLLPLSEQSAINQTLSRYLVQELGFAVQNVVVKTLPEVDEAILGWIDVNYLKNNFEQNAPATVGSIDMGGASTEIAFEVEPTKANSKYVQRLNINSKDHFVFAQNFLGLGLDVALQEINKLPNKNSCYVSGYDINKDGTQFGNYNFTNCMTNYNELIDSKIDHDVNYKALVQNTQFIAYSGVYYSFNFFGLKPNDGPEKLFQMVTNLCTEDWNVFSDQKNKNTSPDRLGTFCANGTYIYDVLHNYYQLSENNVTVTNKISLRNEVFDIDWTLGAVLYHSDAN